MRQVSFLRISQKSVISYGSSPVSPLEFLILHVSSFAECLGKFMGASNLVVKFGFERFLSQVTIFRKFSKLTRQDDSIR